MKVEIINTEEVKELFSHWGKFSSVCYNTKTNTPEKVGKHCMNSGHLSGSRSRYIEFIVTDVARLVVDQAVRHEEGVCKNVQSFRYVDKNYFAYEIPKEIINNKELLNRYHNHMKNTIEIYSDIQSYVFDEVFKRTNDKNKAKERANEQARYVIPMATHSAFAIGFSLEALIHYMNTRLCVRTEDVHRELAIAIKNAVLKVLPELKDRLVPNCQNLLWCPEGKMCCGAYPTKEEVGEILNKIKENKK